MLMNGWTKMFKCDFPIFQNCPDLVFLDSAASAQKPQCVLNAMNDFYTHSYSNVHRGNCDLAGTATNLYESARRIVADFIGCASQNIGEHHADFVPWQQLCLRTRAVLKIVEVTPEGGVDMVDFQSKLSGRTKLVAVTHQSNVLGVENPIKTIIAQAHQHGALVLIDGAQSVAHMPVNVLDLDCDYFVFSGHKLYGPTGVGVLYGKTSALERLHPTVFGGDMVREVTLQKTTFADLPARLEAGTPPFVQAYGLAEAIRYVSEIGMEKIASHEKKLTQKLIEQLKTIKGVHILGGGYRNLGLVSFVVDGIHPSDIAFALSKQHICVRVGHHCAMPIHTCLKTSVSLRVSFGLYNDESDIDIFVKALKKALSFF